MSTAELLAFVATVATLAVTAAVSVWAAVTGRGTRFQLAVVTLAAGTAALGMTAVGGGVWTGFGAGVLLAYGGFNLGVHVMAGRYERVLRPERQRILQIAVDVERNHAERQRRLDRFADEIERLHGELERIQT